MIDNKQNDNFLKMQNNIANKNIYLDNYPARIYFLINDKCYSKCMMCGGDYFRSTTGREITIEKFKIMAANLKLDYCNSIFLAGASDTLLNKDMIPIIQFLRKQYPNLNISIITNGIALSEEISKALLENDINSINISINSATKETYNKIMQIDCFDLVYQNTKTFIELKNQMNKNTIVQFSIALSRLNIDELPLLIEAGKQIGIDSVTTRYCRFYPERISYLSLDKPEDSLNNDTSLYYHEKLAIDMVEKAEILAKKYSITFINETISKLYAGDNSCIWPVEELMIGVDGEVYPSDGGELHFKGQVEKGIYKFGNVLKESINTFWNSEIYRTLRISSKQNELKSLIYDWNNEKNQLDYLSQKYFLNVKKVFDDFKPLVSVIVPTYNHPDMLMETLKSMLNQTYKNFEVIVVNDSGSDVENIISFFNKTNNITYIKHNKNRGPAAARNTGIKLARGKYIAYLDNGDIFYVNHLETLVDYLENNDCKVAYTDAYCVHKEEENGRYVIKKKEISQSFDFDHNLILRENFIPFLCFMHEKTCFDEVGYFDETLCSHENWDLLIGMSKKFKFSHIKKTTCEYSFLESNITFINKEDKNFTCEIFKERGEKPRNILHKFIKRLPLGLKKTLIKNKLIVMIKNKLYNIIDKWDYGKV